MGDLFSHYRPLEGGAQSLCRLLFMAKGHGFLNIDQGHFFSTQTVGLAGHIATNITGTDDHNFFTDFHG